MIDLRDKDHSRVYQTTLTKIEAQPANQITKDFIINIDLKTRILILNRLKDRQIGKMKDNF